MPCPPPTRPSLIPALLLSLSACLGPSYSKDRVEASVQEICRKEYDLTVTARLVGKTLYCENTVEGLVGADLDMEPKKFESLDKMLRVLNRVALSTDAELEFLVIQIRDDKLTSRLDLLQRVEDYRSLRNMRISQDDFQNGLVLEWSSDNKPEPATEVTMADFIARLAASRLHRKFTGNPLVSVVLQIQAVEGRVDDKTLVLALERAVKSSAEVSSHRLLEAAAQDVAVDVLRVYDPGQNVVTRIRLEALDGHVFWEVDRAELAKRAAARPAGKTAAAPLL